MVLAYVAPIWVFHYFPTQDGPQHVATSITVKDHGAAGTHYHEFFDLRLEPFPNWIAQLLLIGFLFVVPALVAEKLLVSFYVLLLAGSLRYFCGAFGERTRPCALLGLLFVYNRCLWMGFYNSDLSLALGFLILGYWLRRLDRADLTTAATLALLVVAAYFTHLVGYVVTALGVVWFALTSPRHRLRNIGWAFVAMIPAALLAWEYLDRTGFFRVRLQSGMWNELMMWLGGRESWIRFKFECAQLQSEAFYHHVQDEFPMGLVALGLFAVLAVVTVFTRRSKSKPDVVLPWQWPVAVLAVGFFVLYVLARDDLGDHGGFLKSRLALLPPLVFLGWFRIPSIPEVRLVLGTFVLFILSVNLIFVFERIEADNRDLAEYTAGLPAVGTGKVLFVYQGTQRPFRSGKPQICNPLLHAAGYYCYDTGNVNLDNYQAEKNYFPLRYREGFWQNKGFLIGNNQMRQVVDVIIAWGNTGRAGVPPDFEAVFQRGQLAIFAKRRD